MTGLGAGMLQETALPQAVFHRVCERSESVAVSSYLQGGNYTQRILAAVMLVPALPIIGVLILLIRATSKGPAVFKQLRVGRGGTLYTMYKLRTMHCDAEADTGPIWSTPNDDRTTWLGRLLRKAHLDELPQLLNVVKGEMSLVGPRPERPEFVGVLEEEVPGYCQRLRVLPGITGLAQVNLPADTNTASVRRKLRLDLEYIETADLQLDLQIILCTLLKVFCLPSAWRTRMTGISRAKFLADINGEERHLVLTPAELAAPRYRSTLNAPNKPK